MYTVTNHVTNDVCFIPIMGAAILKFLPARRRFSRFYDTEEHLLENKRTSDVSKQYYLISQFDLLCLGKQGGTEFDRSQRLLSNDQEAGRIKKNKHT